MMSKNLAKYEINEAENGFLVHIGSRQEDQKTPVRKRLIAKDLKEACDFLILDYTERLSKEGT